MNSFLYHLASGHAWFTCGALFLIAAALDARDYFRQRKGLAAVTRVLLLAGLILAGAGTTPLALWLAVPVLAACLAYTFFGLACRSRRRRLLLAGTAAVAVLIALAVELPYHFPAAPAGPPPGRLYVIADSMGAGFGTERTTWPRLLREAGIDVRDLSFPGARVGSALRKLREAPEFEADRQAWVLLCIGGNDMLGGTPAAEFVRGLDGLLASARGDGAAPRTVLMLEVPLIPGAWEFGAQQRRLAGKYGVVLVPKRLLAGAILTGSNVVDGLHLSPAGHAEMAGALARWLGR